MIPHNPPENPNIAFDINREKRRVTYHFTRRNVPVQQKDKLLIATWNLTNFGLQKRTSDHLKTMAHIMSRFDVIAVQEVADDLTQFQELVSYMSGNYEAIFSDIAGNYERLGYVYDASKLKRKGLIAELAMRSSERRRVTIEVGDEKEEMDFEGFNRNPYMATFAAGSFEFTLVNVHLFWSDTRVRLLETKALSTWAKKRSKKPVSHLPSKDIMLIGDFNIPKLNENDQYYQEIISNGLQAPIHDTEYIGSNLAGDKSYDQLFFFPSHTSDEFVEGKIGVFDFDNVLFRDLWKSDTSIKKVEFFKYIRYFIADHRPLWAQFDI